jgi:DNA topoisomerase-1
VRYRALTPKAAARAVHLHYINDEAVPGIARKGSAGRFHYLRPTGTRVRDKATLTRNRKLAIPPAWH